MRHFTHLTSFLLLLPALASPGTWRAPWFATLAGISFARHSLYHRRHSGKAILVLADRSLAHAIAARTSLEALRLPAGPHAAAFWSCLLYVVVVYYRVVRRRPGLQTPAHETMHLASVAGALALCLAPAPRR